MANQKKVEKVKKITELLSNKKNFVLIGFEKVPHKTLEEIRKKLAQKLAKLTVIKNTLFEKAFDQLININVDLKLIKEKFFPLKRTSALLTFDNEWFDGLSVFYQLVKGEKTFSFKFGWLGNQAYDDRQLLKIATLPSIETLLAKLILTFKSPAWRLIFAAKFSQMKLVNVINQITKKKGGELNDRRG